MSGISDTVSEERTAWFRDTIGATDTGQISDQAAALLVELETIFVAGAWVATVILAAAVIDAEIRAEGDSGRYTNTGVLFREAGLGADFDWLRKRRNELLHFSGTPALTVDMFWFQSDALEADARRAVELVRAMLSGEHSDHG
ncbi:MAG: hypothetical protein AAF414_07445 [Pseudomonadota bacterium]